MLFSDDDVTMPGALSATNPPADVDLLMDNDEPQPSPDTIIYSPQTPTPQTMAKPPEDMDLLMDNDEPPPSQTSHESNPGISASDGNPDRSRPLARSRSADHLTSSKSTTVSTFEKRVPKEVNHSAALRKTLYEKEDIINRFIVRLRQIKVVHLQEKEALHKQIRDLQEASHLELEGQRAKITELNQLIRERELAYQEERAKLQEQMQSANEAIAELEKLMRAREQANRRERDMLQEQMHATNKATALQHKTDIDKLQKQFEADMKDQLEKVVAASRLNLTNALEQRDQELNEKLRTLEENMRVAQGNDSILNPEQQYARQLPQFVRISPPPPNNETNDELPVHPAPERQSKTATRPSSSPVLVTPNLDTIKRLKKSRGFSRRTHLIQVQVDAEDAVSHTTAVRQGTQYPSHADATMGAALHATAIQQGTQYPAHADAIQQDASTRAVPVQQETYPFNQATFDAMMKGFEAAFRNVLTGGQAFPHRTHAPPRKRRQEEQEVREQRLQETNIERDFFLNEVRKLFKAKFDFSQDNDFIAYDPADPCDVYAYEFEDGPGPDVDRPSFDLLHGPTSTWNKAVVEILLHEFQDVCQSQGWPFRRSNDYIKVLIIERYKRLRTVWRKAQPKLTERGVLETPSEMEERLIAERNAVLKASRQTTRRRNKYIRRVMVLEHLIKLKTKELEDDLDAWVWLKNLVTGLREHGMSSEESDDENDLETIL